jgi:hypothetical protein
MREMRFGIILVVVALGAMMTKGALEDSERGLQTLPWLLLVIASLIFLAWPRRR